MLEARQRSGEPTSRWGTGVVTDPDAIAHFKNSWQSEFAGKFGVEFEVVEIDESLRQKILAAQRNQYR